MLPPVDEAVLQSNPDFERLYKTVTTSLLNPDGSSKSNDPAAKRRDAIRDELRTHRLRVTKEHLLRRAITAAAKATSNREAREQHQQSQPQPQPNRRTRSSRPQSLTTITTTTTTPPPEILDLLLLLPPFLTTAPTLPPTSLSLLLSRPPFSDLPTLFPALAATLSSTLTRQASTLARVLSPNTNPSFIHRAIPTMASTTSSLQSALQSSSLALSASRRRATHDLVVHLTQHTRALSHLLRVLEAKHGPAARSAELRAADAALAARAWALATEALLWDSRQAVYPPEARRALANYRRHLADARMRLGDAIRVREAELEEYGVAVVEGGRGDEGKERTMREMARVWREMETRLEEVRGDLNRLG